MIHNLSFIEYKEAFKKIEKKDLARRKRVGEIFGEGCINSSKDYFAAALIYQHGNVPDHYYQTYIWAKRASELDEDMKRSDLIALAIDRYLISIGKKQLFGSQYKGYDFKDNLNFGKHCFCMQPVEINFPDGLRKAYGGMTLTERSEMMDKMFNEKKGCPCGVICNSILKSTPKGSVVGLW